MMKLYENIKALRKEKGWTQQRLAELTGYTDRSSIAKIEAGCVDLSQAKIEQFARVFNVSPVELMGFETIQDAKDEINMLFNKLTPDQQESVLSFLRTILGDRATT